MKTNVNAALRPTLWRTCRALANPKRLAVLRWLSIHGERDVSAVAQAMSWPLSLTSEALRMLNARGLLSVRRSGRHVCYRVGTDRSLPESALLLKAVVKLLGQSGSSSDDICKILTGVTHPRRQQILQLLRRQMRFGELKARTRISAAALCRHLGKLRARGLVERSRDRYRLAWPGDPLRQALLELADR